MAWWKRRTRGPDAAALTTWTPEGGSLARCSALGARAPRADLRGIDLSSANLTHSSLQRSRLEWAMLQSTALNHANLRRANLRWAVLRRAELVGTDLRKADLTAADLSGAITCPQVPAELKAAGHKPPVTNLQDAILRDSRLLDADLSGADLRGADLSGAMYSSETVWPAGFDVSASGAIQSRWPTPAPMQRIQLPGHGGLPLRLVPSGNYMIGWMADWKERGESPYGRRHDEPDEHLVRTSSFYISPTQVTQGLYKAVMGHNPSDNPASNAHPVETVSWREAVRFCNALSEACGLQPAYTIKEKITCDFKGHGFRLPTPLEWEIAARAEQDFHYSGSNDFAKVSWNDHNSGGKTHPVGQKKPNAWGLYDMSGNVSEWCWAIRWGELVEDISRGGAFRNYWYFANLRVYARNQKHPKKDKTIGLRIVRTAPAVA